MDFTGRHAQECVGMEVECKNQHLGCKWATRHVGMVGMAISNGGTCLDRQLRDDFEHQKDGGSRLFDTCCCVNKIYMFEKV